VIRKDSIFRIGQTIDERCDKYQIKTYGARVNLSNVLGELEHNTALEKKQVHQSQTCNASLKYNQPLNKRVNLDQVV
jgi:hypothetical protein